MHCPAIYAIMFLVSERNTVMKIRLEDSWKDYFNQVADMLSEDALHYADVMEISRVGFVEGWSIEEAAHQCEQEV